MEKREILRKITPDEKNSEWVACHIIFPDKSKPKIEEGGWFPWIESSSDSECSSILWHGRLHIRILATSSSPRWHSISKIPHSIWQLWISSSSYGINSFRKRIYPQRRCDSNRFGWNFKDCWWCLYFCHKERRIWITNDFKIFKRCEESRMTLNGYKIQMGRKVQFGGFIVGANSLEKLCSLTNFPWPENITDLPLTRFANFLGAFCQDLEIALASLRELIKTKKELLRKKKRLKKKEFNLNYMIWFKTRLLIQFKEK